MNLDFAPSCPRGVVLSGEQESRRLIAGTPARRGPPCGGPAGNQGREAREEWCGYEISWMEWYNTFGCIMYYKTVLYYTKYRATKMYCANRAQIHFFPTKVFFFLCARAIFILFFLFSFHRQYTLMYFFQSLFLQIDESKIA